jgi:hypothetical protein
VSRASDVVPQAELEDFFEQPVTNVQAKGGACAITSGMACVQYGVAQATKDCDLLCSADSARELFGVLRATPLHGAGCRYRGHLTPPLDRRWLRGARPSHFQWEQDETAAYLDVFGETVFWQPPKLWRTCARWSTVSTFGEEMARVNFMPLQERKLYVYDMIDNARRKGVKFEKPASGVTR